MTPSEYFDEAKKTMELTSDYEFAKRMDIPRSYMPTLRSGERHIPIELMFKLAITLNLDPARVVADLESQRKANKKSGDFWRGFLSRATIVAALVCTLALSFSGMQGNGAARLGGKTRRFNFV